MASKEIIDALLDKKLKPVLDEAKEIRTEIADVQVVIQMVL